MNIIFAVSFYSGIMDHARPIHSKAEIVCISFRILMADHIMRHILELLLNSFHIRRYLNGKQTGGLRRTSENIQRP